AGSGRAAARRSQRPFFRSRAIMSGGIVPFSKGVKRPGRQATTLPTVRRCNMASATWIRDELEQRGIAYEELHHPDVFTAQEVAQREHVSGHRVAKVVCAPVHGKPGELGPPP